MAKYSNTVEYNLKTTLDASGVAKLQTELRGVQNELQRMRGIKMISPEQSSEAIAKIKEIEKALTKAFNSNLGMLNISQFTKELSVGNKSILDWSKSFNLAGTQGQMAMTSLIGRLGQVDTGLKSVSKTTDKVFNTIGNTVRWGLIASAFQSVMNNAHEAVNYIKELDRSLNDIRIVSDYNAQDMREFSLYANEAARALGQTTVAYTDASLIFAQQGFNLDDANQLAEMTLKVANTTGQATDEVSEQITSWMNGYQMSLDQVGETLDKVTKVAAVGAADTEELMTAASKVASTANMLGVTEDQLITQMSTIISVTREAPENIGNSLKTIYARLGDLQMGETLEDGTSLGNLSSTLEKVGIQILDDTGAMRNMGDVLEELMNKWGSFDRAQQQALAVKLAGKYQYSRFSALMQNEEMYQSQLKESMESTGFLERTQDIYMESLAAKSKSLQAATEGLISNLFDPDSIKPFEDSLITVVDLLSDLVDSVGGGIPVMTAFGAVATKVFSKNIANGINNFTANRKREKDEFKSQQARTELSSKGLNDKDLVSGGKDIYNFVKDNVTNTDLMSDKQLEQYNSLVKQSTENVLALKNAEDRLKQSVEVTNEVMAARYGLKDAVVFDEKNQMYDTSQLDQLLFLNTDLNPSDIATETMQEYFTGATNAMTNLGGTTSAFDDLLKTKNIDNFIKKIDNATTGVADGIAQMRKSGIASSETLTMLENMYDKIIVKTDKLANTKDLKIDTEDAQKSIAELMEELEQLRNRLLEANKQKIDPFAADVQKKIANKDAADAAVNTDKAALDQFSKGMQDTKKTYDVTQMVASIGELAFAWQSFQSLGSLWANADMSEGEKLQQTILNLAMTVPMLMNSFNQLNKSDFTKKAIIYTGNLSDKLGLLAAGYQQTGKEALQSEKKSNMFGKSQLAMGKLTQGAAIAVSGLGKAMSALGGPVGVAMLAISAITATISYFNEQSEQLYQEAKERATQSNEYYLQADEARKNFNIALEDYKDGVISFEELEGAVQSCKDIFGEQIDITDLLTQSYDNLSNSINSAADKEKQRTIDNNSQAIAEAEKHINGSDVYESLKGSRTGGSIKEGTDSYSNEAFATQAKNLVNTNNILGYYKLLDKELTDIAEERRNIQEKMDISDRLSEGDSEKLSNAQYDEYKNRLQEIAKEYASITEAQSNEYLQTYISSLEENAKYQSEDFLKANASLNPNELISLAEQQSNDFGRTINSYDDYVDKLQYLIEHTTDQNQQLNLALEKGYTSSGRELYNKVNQDGGMFNWLQNDSVIEDNDNLINSLKEEVYQHPYVNTEAINDAFIQSILDQVKNSSLDESEQMELLNNLDWSKPIEDILATVQKSVNSGKVIENYDDQNDNGSRTSRLKEEYDVDEGQIDIYKDVQKEIYQLDDAEQKLQETIKDTSKQFGEESDEAKNAKKQLDKFNDQTDDLTKLSIQSQKGMDALTESIEGNADTIRNADKNSLAYSEAIEETRSQVADLLNVTEDDISIDFVTDNLDDIEAAANGDIDALNRLRGAAATDIVTSIYLSEDSTLTTDHVDWLTSKLDELATMNIEPYAAIQDQDFIDGLNEMLENGELTATQLNSALNAVGFDPDIEMVEADTTLFDLSAYKLSVPMPLDMPPLEFNLPPILVKGKTQVPKISSTDNPNAGGSGGIRSIGGGSYAPAVAQQKAKSSGGGGKKGGSGGSGKSYEPKKKDPIEEEIDRYERVDTLLGAIEKDYDKINNERDRLAGWNIADNMNKEIDLLQKQILLHEEKLKIQREEQKELANDLANKYGGRFDADGFLTNYEAIHRKLESDVNNLINQYNNTSDEAGQEVLEEQIEAAQKVLDSFKEDYKRYDELVSSDLKETINTIEDLTDSIEDLRIEAFQTQIEAADNIKDINEALIDFNAVFSGLQQDNPFREMSTSAAKLKNYFDDAGNAVDAYYDKLISRSKEALNDPQITQAYRDYLTNQINLMEQARNAAQSGDIEQYGLGYLDMTFTNLNTMLDQIKQYQAEGSSAIFGKNEGQMFEVAKDVFDQAADMVHNLEDNIDELRDAIIDAIDDIAERVDERKTQYENITEELEHQRDIIEMLHGDRAYAEINQALAAQQNNYQQSIREMQAALDLWKDLLDNLEEGSEEWKAVNEQITDTQKELNDLVKESLDNLKEQYENSMNDILDNWSNSPFGNDLDWIEEEWELINRNADYYLDQTNAAYETQKLQGEYLKLLDGSNDLHVQQMITDQMKEQLGYLREKKNISEYDVAYANAQLEILQKRIALEEAQRNKNQIKLRRDSQGNYSYVYTANQDDVADKEGDLLDAQNNAYNLSKEQMKQTQADSLSALGDAKNLLNNIWNDANLTLEEKKKRTETVINSLKEYLDGTSEQLSTSQKNIINDFIGMVDMMTEENTDRLKDVYTEIINGNHDAFDQIDTRWSTSLTNWLQNLDEFKNNTDQAFSDLTSNATDYQDQVDAIGDLIKTDFNDMGSAIEDVKNKTDDLAASQTDFINQLKNDSGIIKEYEKTLSNYASKIADAQNSMKAYQDQVNELGNTIKAKEQENASLTSQVKDLQSTVNAYKEGIIGGDGSGGGGSLSPGSTVKLKPGHYYHNDSQGNGPHGNWSDATKISHTNPGAPYPIHLTSPSGGWRGWVRKEDLVGYDTGGYTGMWEGPKESGKLALLHQKELVLNASDTENILQAVQAVRDMTLKMKNSVFDNILANLNTSGFKSDNNKDIVQQEVHITAEFPNVESADDIRESLLSLNEQAMQYAFRER